MSEQTNYCTTKGLGWALLIIVLMLTALPVLITLAMVGVEDYAKYCNMAIHLPCFGLN
ncbi:MAG: hypothetical protein HOM88_03135 [Hellea sp.]|nr:hypothetical protein [Hellea sp.]